MRDLIREYIRKVLSEQVPRSARTSASAPAHPSVSPSGTALKYIGDSDDSDEGPDNLLLEPDDPDQDERPDEASGAAAVAGVTVPLGAGPTYPSRPKKKRRKKNRK